MKFDLTKHNPDYEKIRENGFAFIIEPIYPEGGKHGSPYLDENYQPVNPERTRIIWWDNDDN